MNYTYFYIFINPLFAIGMPNDIAILYSPLLGLAGSPTEEASYGSPRRLACKLVRCVPHPMIQRP
jgi:hypothetical protein